MSGWVIFALVVAALGCMFVAAEGLVRALNERSLNRLGVVDVDAEAEAEHEHARRDLHVRPTSRPYDQEEEDRWAPEEEWQP